MVTQPPFQVGVPLTLLQHKTAAAKRLKLFTSSSVFIHTINSDGNKTHVQTQLISSTLL